MGNNAFVFGPDGGLEQTVSAPFSGTIFLLHGLGADSSDLAGIIPYLDLLGEQAVRFLMPNATLRSVRVNQGMGRRGKETGCAGRQDFSGGVFPGRTGLSGSGAEKYG